MLVNLPSFAFGLFAPNGPSFVPPGTYNIGFACTLGVASPTQQDKFWNVQMTFSIAPTDLPAGFTWIVGTPPPPTTTTTVAPTTTTIAPTTTTIAPTTTTTIAPTTTTTVPPTSTTTTVPGQTTTTVKANDENEKENENENENECKPKHSGRHSHPRSEDCRPERKHGRSSSQHRSSMRIRWS